MSIDDLSVVLFVDCDFDLSLLLIRGSKDRNIRIGAHSADSLGVEARVDGVY
jgi:hypothetical protein